MVAGSDVSGFVEVWLRPQVPGRSEAATPWLDYQHINTQIPLRDFTAGFPGKFAQIARFLRSADMLGRALAHGDLVVAGQWLGSPVVGLLWDHHKRPLTPASFNGAWVCAYDALCVLDLGVLVPDA